MLRAGFLRSVAVWHQLSNKAWPWSLLAQLKNSRKTSLGPQTWTVSSLSCRRESRMARYFTARLASFLSQTTWFGWIVQSRTKGAIQSPIRLPQLLFFQHKLLHDLRDDLVLLADPGLRRRRLLCVGMHGGHPQQTNLLLRAVMTTGFQRHDQSPFWVSCSLSQLPKSDIPTEAGHHQLKTTPSPPARLH